MAHTLTTEEIVRLADPLPEYTAADLAARGRAWEVPASALYAAHGVPTQSQLGSSSGLLLGPGASADAQAGAKRRKGSAGKRGASAGERETSAGALDESADERIMEAAPVGAQTV